MSDLKDKILKGYIKMYFISENRLAIYGKTYELRNELKNIGAVWNPKRKRLELDEEDFKKLDNEIIEKTFELSSEVIDRCLILLHLQQLRYGMESVSYFHF